MHIHLHILIIVLASITGWAADSGVREFPTTPIQRGRHVWSPDANASHLKSGAVSRVERGSFTIGTTVAGIPQVVCQFLVPVGKAGNPLPTANDIVLRFGYMNQVCLGDGDPVVMLAERYGFSLLSIIWPDQKVDRNYDQRHSIYPESGSGDAWLQSIAALRTIWGMGPGDVYTIGWSAGGSAAFQFSNSRPAMVDGVVAIGGRHFPDRPVYNGPTLLMHSEKDRPVQNLMLETALKEEGAAVTRVTFPPGWTERGKDDNWAHNVDGRSWELGIEWIVALSEMRRSNQGAPRPVDMWPVSHGFRFPGKSDRTVRLLASLSAQSLIKSLGDGGAIARSSTGENNERAIWTIDYRVTSNEDDAMAHAQLFSSLGGDSISIIFGLATPGDPRDGVARNLERPSKPSCLVMIEPRGEFAILGWIASMPTLKEIVVFRPKPDLLPVLQQIAAPGKARLTIIWSQPAPPGAAGEGRVRYVPWTEVSLPGEQYRQERTKISEVLGVNAP